MKRKQQVEIPPKIILLILSVVCIVLLFFTMFFSRSVPFLDQICGVVLVPMERGVNAVGDWVNERIEDVKESSQLRQKNKELQNEVDELRQQVASLQSDQSELDDLRKLYDLDQKYESYSKVGARIIATDSSNWYSTFTIDKGSKDGIQEDMNVIAGEGLVGIVYSVGKNYAKVRSIIDDTSYVSAMFSTTADNCLVNGDLKSIEDGYITVDHINKDARINEGDELVTSNVSSKFLPGITIGYVSDIEVDSNSLTKSGKVTPIVDFKHLEEVLVITQIKETGEESTDKQSKKTSSKQDSTTGETATTEENQKDGEE
ncbi:MAG: rod shape-determining protein MreC [Lachnospiraceae bacterium]|nr:rod shape-determining protein MreC [Lachnospiraceae bacterium]